MGRLITAWTLVLMSAALCVALLVAVEAPSSGSAHVLASVLPIPDVAASDFGRDLNLAAGAKPLLRPPLYAAAEKDAVAELRSAPMKPDAWLRLAYVRTLLSGGFSDAAAAAYSRSYAVAPIDPSVAVFRIHFGLQSWKRLSPPLQKNVASELESLWAAAPEGHEKLAAAVASVADPEGRAAGEAILTNIGWTPDHAAS